MLRAAVWLSRTTGLIVVGLLTFLAPPSTEGGVAAQVVCFAVMAVGVGCWGLAELRPAGRGRFARLLLPAALTVVVAAACAGAAVGSGGTSMIGFAATSLMSAAELLSMQAAIAIAVLGVLVLEVGGVVYGQGIGTMLGLPLLLLVGILFGRTRAAYRVQAEQASRLLAQHELLRAEQRRADVLDERARIAREIHDVLAHSLGALGIQLQTVKALFTVHEDPERALEALAVAQRMAVEGLTETRRAVHALRTDTRPLPEELARIAAEHTARHHVAVHCETAGTPVPLPPEGTVALLRTAQESLVNAAKHAPGAEIGVRLEYADGIRLTVSNPLIGDGLAPGGVALHTVDSGYGLTGMSERLLLLRGSLHAGVRGDSWVVEAELPLPAASAAHPDKDDR